MNIFIYLHNYFFYMKKLLCLINSQFWCFLKSLLQKLVKATYQHNTLSFMELCLKNPSSHLNPEISNLDTSARGEGKTLEQKNPSNKYDWMIQEVEQTHQELPLCPPPLEEGWISDIPNKVVSLCRVPQQSKQLLHMCTVTLPPASQCRNLSWASIQTMTLILKSEYDLTWTCTTNRSTEQSLPVNTDLCHLQIPFWAML